MEGKCVLDVADPHPISLDEYANDVEPIGVRGPAVAIDPDPRRAAQLLLLPPVDRFQGEYGLGAQPGQSRKSSVERTAGTVIPPARTSMRSSAPNSASSAGSSSGSWRARS